MTGPDDPQYPGPFSYPPPPPPGGAGHGAAHWPPFDGRLAIRPAPRGGAALAGVGAGVLMLGGIVWAFSYILDGLRESVLGDGSSSRHLVAAVVFLVLVAVGYGIAVIRRRGPLVTAAVTVTAIGVPLMMSLFTTDPAKGSAANGDAVFWVSIAAYLVSYFVVRGTRGHTLYIGLAALQLWSYVVVKAEPHLGQAVSARILGGVQSIPGLVLPPSDVSLNTAGGISIAFGIVYLAVAFWLDRTGRHGAATPFALVGLLVVLVAVAAFAPDIKQIGSGLLLLTIGLALVGYGGRNERRFTTWTGALAAGFGAVLVVAKLLDDSGGATSGIWVMVLGLAIVAAGVLLRAALSEPDDMARATAPATQQQGPVGWP
jgi:hypothetical protein